MYNRKRAMEELPLESTQIWSCTVESCKGWMRDNFAFEAEPTCRLCNAPMARDTRMLPALSNGAPEFMAKKDEETT